MCKATYSCEGDTFYSDSKECVLFKSCTIDTQAKNAISGENECTTEKHAIMKN